MQIKQLEYVREIARRGSITQVADKFYISRQALSVSIKLLEKELGFAIFCRSNKGVMLTKEGETLVNDLETILPLVQRWYKLNSGEEKRKVKILIHYILSDSIINTNLISRLTEITNLDITLENVSGANFVEKFRECENCIGLVLPSKVGIPYHEIMELEEQSSNIVIETLADTSMCVVISEKDILATKEHLYLSDLHGKALVRTKSSNLSTVIQYIVQTTEMDGYILPEAVDLLSFVAKTKNTFAFLPQICLKNNLYIQTGALKVLSLEDYHDSKGTCYLVYSKHNIATNRDILDAIRENYHV